MFITSTLKPTNEIIFFHQIEVLLLLFFSVCVTSAGNRC